MWLVVKIRNVLIESLIRMLYAFLIYPGIMYYKKFNVVSGSERGVGMGLPWFTFQC